MKKIKILSVFLVFNLLADEVSIEISFENSKPLIGYFHDLKDLRDGSKMILLEHPSSTKDEDEIQLYVADPLLTGGEYHLSNILFDKGKNKMVINNTPNRMKIDGHEFHVSFPNKGFELKFDSRNKKKDHRWSSIRFGKFNASLVCGVSIESASMDGVAGLLQAHCDHGGFSGKFYVKEVYPKVYLLQPIVSINGFEQLESTMIGELVFVEHVSRGIFNKTRTSAFYIKRWNNKKREFAYWKFVENH